VRKVSPDGVITRVAGTGAVGNTGDDGPTTAAELGLPRAVAVTADGGFLIADPLNSVVRKVAPRVENQAVAHRPADGPNRRLG
jgi:serine/threonine-protein kinase